MHNYYFDDLHMLYDKRTKTYARFWTKRQAKRVLRKMLKLKHIDDIAGIMNLESGHWAVKNQVVGYITYDEGFQGQPLFDKQHHVNNEVAQKMHDQYDIKFK